MVAAKAARSTSGGSNPQTRFKGWGPDVVDFFDELEMDNTKSFWTAHKEFYEAEVLGPMKALLAELEPEFGTGRIFRPYRDTRFSADKSPYKTNIGAHVQTGYISLSSSALGVGSGLYLPSPAQLASYRAAVADGRTGAELVALVDELRGNGIDVMAHDVLKSAPRGVAKDHPRIDLLRHKGLAAWREWPVGAWLSTARTKVRIVEFLRATAPLRAWLDANVDGPEGT